MLLEEYKCIKHFPLAPPLDSLTRFPISVVCCTVVMDIPENPIKAVYPPCTSQFPLTNAQTMQIDMLRLDKLA